MGKVPVLQLKDESEVLYESGVIADYLDEAFPGPKLTPADPLQRAKDKILIEHYSQVLKFHYQLYYKCELSDKEKAEVGEDMLSKLDFVEKDLVKRGTPFFGGETVMMVDYMIWPWFERILIMPAFTPNTEMTQTRFPKLVGFNL